MWAWWWWRLWWWWQGARPAPPPKREELPLPGGEAGRAARAPSEGSVEPDARGQGEEREHLRHSSTPYALFTQGLSQQNVHGADYSVYSGEEWPQLEVPQRRRWEGRGSRGSRGRRVGSERWDAAVIAHLGEPLLRVSSKRVEVEADRAVHQQRHLRDDREVPAQCLKAHRGDVDAAEPDAALVRVDEAEEHRHLCDASWRLSWTCARGGGPR